MYKIRCTTEMMTCLVTANDVLSVSLMLFRAVVLRKSPCRDTHLWMSHLIYIIIFIISLVETPRPELDVCQITDHWFIIFQSCLGL